MAGGGKKDDAARGWSLVLERDGHADEETDEHFGRKPRPPRGEERTVIDPAIAGAVLSELDREEKRPARDTDPGESPPPFQFQDLTVPSAVGDQTSVDPVPIVPPDLTEPLFPSYSAHEIDTYDDPIKEPSLPAPIIHKDPATGSRRAIKDRGAVKTRHDAEVTVLDLAARLGLPPEPAGAPRDPDAPPAPAASRLRVDGPSPAVVLPPPDVGPSRVAAIPAASTRADARRTPPSGAQVVLPLPDETGGPLGAQGVQVTALLNEEAENQAARPGAAGYKAREAPVDHLPRWLAATQNLAKLIPLVLGIFVVLSTVAVGLLMFQGVGSTTTEHVTLRFLPVKLEPGQHKPSPFEPAPSVRIETEPPGLLVILDSKILGTTPLVVQSAVRGERIGVEIQSPYYETWIGEAARRESGDLGLNARLTRKRR